MISKRPNVILITVDSLRADHLGCYSYSRPTSPNIDHFAKESYLFTNAFSNGPNTPHAFPAIMASRYPLMSNRLGLFDAPVTLAEGVKFEGYATAGFNAANPYISKYFHYDRGFDVFNDYLDFEISIEKEDFDFKNILCSDSLSRETAKQAYDDIPVPKMNIDRYLVTEESMERKSWLEFCINRDIFQWLERCADAPFFIWLHYMDTHYPYVPQTRFQFEMGMRPFTPLEMLQINTRIRESLLFSSEGLQRAIDLYDCAIRQLDKKIGEVMRCLQKHDLYDSSLIILTADHGEEFQEHGDLQHKSKMFDELIRVPFLMKLPYTQKASVHQQLIGLINLAPTIMSLLHLENPFESDSIFNGFEYSESLGMPYVIAEASYGINGATPVDVQMLDIDPLPKIYCYRDKQWKMILDKRKNQTYLFNLLMDPNEKYNLYDDRNFQTKQLHKYLEEHIKCIEKNRLSLKIGQIQEKLNVLLNFHIEG